MYSNIVFYSFLFYAICYAISNMLVFNCILCYIIFFLCSILFHCIPCCFVLFFIIKVCTCVSKTYFPWQQQAVQKSPFLANRKNIIGESSDDESDFRFFTVKSTLWANYCPRGEEPSLQTSIFLSSLFQVM